jgi:hypothetical protein
MSILRVVGEFVIHNWIKPRGRVPKILNQPDALD